MLQAARKGDLDTIRRLIVAGVKADVSDEWDSTPLMLAAGWGHTEIVATLIDSGARVDERSRFNRTALMWAAASGQESTVIFLLEAGADKELVDKDGKSAVDLAREENHLKIATLIQSYANGGMNLRGR